MLMDKLLMFSNSQAVTASAASTDTIDLSAFRDIGTGPMDIEVFMYTEVAVTAAGAATLTITLECDDNSAFSSPTVLLSTAAIPKATLVIGYEPLAGWKIPAGCERHVRLNYTVATGPLTAGTFSAGLVLASQRFRAYQNIAL